MPNCFVPGCKSGSKSCTEARRFFFPPKEKTLFEKWSKAVQRNLHSRSYICDKHFSEEFIVKSDKFKIRGEEVLLPRMNWRLKPEAVPHIFLSLSRYTPKNDKKKKFSTNWKSNAFHNIPVSLNAPSAKMTSPDLFKVEPRRNTENSDSSFCHRLLLDQGDPLGVKTEPFETSTVKLETEVLEQAFIKEEQDFSLYDKDFHEEDVKQNLHEEESVNFKDNNIKCENCNKPSSDQVYESK